MKKLLLILIAGLTLASADVVPANVSGTGMPVSEFVAKGKSERDIVASMAPKEKEEYVKESLRTQIVLQIDSFARYTILDPESDAYNSVAGFLKKGYGINIEGANVKLDNLSKLSLGELINLSTDLTIRLSENIGIGR